MATKAYFINSTEAKYSDEEFSWFQSLMLLEGIIGDSEGNLGFVVSENDPLPDMSVLVSAGKALVEIVKDGRTFKIVAESNDVEQLNISANTSGSNRVDAVIIRVDVDTMPNEAKNNIVTVEVITGTGVSALTDGAIDTIVGDDGWIRVANITVPNSATQIFDAAISDQRRKVYFSDGMAFDEEFVSESDGVTDAGKVITLNPEGVQDPSMSDGLNVINGVAGENLTRGNTVFLSDNTFLFEDLNTNTGSVIRSMNASTYFMSNTYTTPNISIPIRLKRLSININRSSANSGGTNYGEFVAFIYAVDGDNKPTGSALATSDTFVISTWNGPHGTITLEFPTAVTLDPNTNYAYVIRYISTDGDTIEIRGGGSPAGFVTSHNSSDGSSWSGGGGAFYLRQEYALGTSGKFYKTIASKAYAVAKFIGIAQKTVSADANTFAVTNGNFNHLSGLTAGSLYYLSNTAGQISTSAGTFSRLIGRANSTTSFTMLLKSIGSPVSASTSGTTFVDAFLVGYVTLDRNTDGTGSCQITVNGEILWYTHATQGSASPRYQDEQPIPVCIPLRAGSIWVASNNGGVVTGWNLKLITLN